MDSLETMNIMCCKACVRYLLASNIQLGATLEADAWYEVCRVTLCVMEDDCVGISDGIRVWSRHSERDTLPHPEEHLKIEHLTSESRHQSELIL